MARKHLLVVDDDPMVRRSLGRALEEKGLKVSSAASAAEGIQLYESGAHDLVILDLFLPDMHGLEVLKQLRERHPEVAVIVVTASDDVRDAVAAMKLGALEYLSKPYDLEALMVLIQHAMEQSRTRQELGTRKKQESRRYSFDLMEHANPGYGAVLALAKNLAQNASVTVLIEGETGVGKEFIARTMHHAGPRAGGPFVPLSCAAIPDTLLESELFGHEAGAFTDARSRKKGLFEMAEGGTLFLDEIGEVSVGMQAKLLRAIETRSFRRVGGTEDLTVDTRLMAATNVVMERALAEKKFREDLYYRLKVGYIMIPPLRDRPEDLLPLARRLSEEVCREMGRRPRGLSPEAEEAFRLYRWPGNVRELKNVLERAVILQDSDGLIEPVHLPHELSGTGGAEADAGAARSSDGNASLAHVEREHVLRILNGCGGNHTRAAKALGIARTTLWEKLKQYNLTA